MDTPEDAFIACRADGTHLNGRALTVSVARSRVFPDVSPFSPHLSLASIAEPGHVARVDPTELQKELLAALDDETMAEIWFRDSLLNVSGDIARFEDVARAAAKDQMRVLVEILAQRPALLADLHPRLFEHLIAALLSASGYREVKLTVASADGGSTSTQTRTSDWASRSTSYSASGTLHDERR